jgi:hypothetical protein
MLLLMAAASMIRHKFDLSIDMARGVSHGSLLSVIDPMRC